MDNPKQTLTASPSPSIRDYDSWNLLGYVAMAFLALAVIAVASQGPAIPDPGFATASVLP